MRSHVRSTDMCRRFAVLAVQPAVQLAAFCSAEKASRNTGIRRTLESKALIPNHSLRSVIRRFVEARAAQPPTPTP